jgi:hypothetical protein
MGKKPIRLQRKNAPQEKVRVPVSEDQLLKNEGWKFRTNAIKSILTQGNWYQSLPDDCLVYLGKPYKPSKKEVIKGVDVSVWTKPKPDY